MSLNKLLTHNPNPGRMFAELNLLFSLIYKTLLAVPISTIRRGYPYFLDPPMTSAIKSSPTSLAFSTSKKERISLLVLSILLTFAL